MHICLFGIVGFIRLFLVEVVLVGWIGWVVVSPHDLCMNFCLDYPDSSPVGLVLIPLGWVCAYVC